MMNYILPVELHGYMNYKLSHGKLIYIDNNECIQIKKGKHV